MANFDEQPWGLSVSGIKRFPLVKDPRTGNSYATARAKDGLFAKNLQFEGGPGSLLTNPGALSGIAGLMTQTAKQQVIAEIVEYLVKIDAKVDDVLHKVDDTVVAQMVGTGHTIERALTIRGESGAINQTLWSTVAGSHQTIAATQAYALSQLDAIAKKLESSSVGGLARTTTDAETDVPKWLAVLARCFQLQEAVDIIELDRVLAESPEDLAAYRRGLETAQQKHRALISDQTESLLDRMDTAAGTANAKLVWTRAKAVAIVSSANHLAVGIQEFQRLLAIESGPRSWEVRQLGRVANLGSQGIQLTKDNKAAIGGVGATAVALAAKKKIIP